MSSQMLINDFLTKQNVSLIWEVIMDDVLKDKPHEIISKINNIFYANLKGFFDNEKNKSRNWEWEPSALITRSNVVFVPSESSTLA